MTKAQDHPTAAPGADPPTDRAHRVGTLNHIRFTVTEIGRAKAFYGVVLGFMGYRLVEKSADRLAWAAMISDGGLQWVILSAAHPDSLDRPHDRYAPGLHHLAWNAEDVTKIFASLFDTTMSRGTTPSFFSIPMA